MGLVYTRRIRGNVHSTNEMTPLENAAVDHPYFQRLRRIKQTAFLSYVFPGATHSRFEHSLGVMQLAGVTWQRLERNQIRLRASSEKYDDFSRREAEPADGLVHGLLSPTFSVIESLFQDDYVLQALRLAGLLHDLGHPPFSHSGERFLPSWGAVQQAIPGLPAYLTDYLAQHCESLRSRGIDPMERKVRHEVFTLTLMDQLLADIAAEFPGLPVIPAQDIAAILTSEIPTVSGSPLAQHGAARLCHEIVSGEFDIDRMDYLLRDSRECGVVYGIFDSERILDSLVLYQNPNRGDGGGGGGLHLAIHYSGLAAFEDYLRARHSMYLQLYFHKTAVAAEAMIVHLGRQLGGWSLPAALDQYAAIDEYNIGLVLEDAARERISDSAARERFFDTLANLIRNRRLWKRVYEGGNVVEGQVPTGPLAVAQRIVDELGCPSEIVSSSTSLTTFQPRRPDQPSRNYLRIVKKDPWQFPRVYPIEDFSQLITADTNYGITRLYIEDRRLESDTLAGTARQRILGDLARGVR